MEQERDWPLEVAVAELRADVRHVAADVAQVHADIRDLRGDIRRIDERMFQMLIAQFATLATVVVALFAAFLG